jgi:hypothetical protein
MDRRLQALLSSDDRAVSARPSLSPVSHPTQCLARSLDGRHCSPLFEYFGVCRPKEASPVPPSGGRASLGNHMDPLALVVLFLYPRSLCAVDCRVGNTGFNSTATTPAIYQTVARRDARRSLWPSFDMRGNHADQASSFSRTLSSYVARICHSPVDHVRRK